MKYLVNIADSIFDVMDFNNDEDAKNFMDESNCIPGVTISAITNMETKAEYKKISSFF